MSNVKLYGNYTNGESQPVTVPKVVAIHSQPNEGLEPRGNRVGSEPLLGIGGKEGEQ